MSRPTAVIGTYSMLAAEYYEAFRHPTSKNFRDASSVLLSPLLPELMQTGDWCCEVGAGKSLVAELSIAAGRPLDRFLAVDSSLQMLEYSSFSIEFGAHLLVGDACSLPVRTESCGTLISVLGDAYNNQSFWHEVHRVVKPGGRAFFTCPAYEWAMGYRPDAEDIAEFDSKEGASVLVPSIVRSVQVQKQLIEGAGLGLEKVTHATIGDLRSDVSSKILPVHGERTRVVTGYVVSKP